MMPTRFPTTIQSTTESRAGPTVEGESVRPGDVLLTPAGDPRVVTGTGYGPAASGVALFHPDAGEHRTGWTEPDGAWTLARLSLGVATTHLGETQYVLTAGFHPRDGTYDCALGTAALGATHVTLGGDQLTATALASLRAAIERAAPPLASTPRGLRERLDEAITALADRRLPAEGATVPAAALSVTGPAIPTGTEPALPLDGTAVAPGDRFVELPAGAPSDPTAVESGTLAEGNCTVVLRQPGSQGIDCVELVAGERATLHPATVERRRRDATYSLGLLGRESFVDPLADAATVSLHCYRLPGPPEPTALLAGTRRSSTTPRLDHPLALPCRGYDGVSSLADALRTPTALDHPLGQWAAECNGVAEMCRRVASRLEN